MSNQNQQLPANQGGRRTNLQIIEDKRNELSGALLQNKHMLSVIAPEKQERFSKNFLELATQDYLLNTIETKEIIRFAVNVSQLGLDIAPSSQEVYIIPFDTKVNGQKVMLPQSIIPLNGMQQLAYNKQFFLELDAVYEFEDGTDGAASQLTRKQQAQLQTANKAWVDKHFIGYDVSLTDLKKELPKQVKFVDKSYLTEATKTIKDPRWQLQTWSHKAVRRAYKEFMIPRNRSIETFEKLEALNDSVLKDIDAEQGSGTMLSKEIEGAIKQLGLSLDKSNGVAIVTGSNVFNHSKTLKELGFSLSNNAWIMQYQEDDIVETQIAETKEPIAPKKSATLKEIKLEMFNFLVDNGLTSEQTKVFIQEDLEISKIEEFEKELNDKDALLEKVKAFINPPVSKASDKDSLFPEGESAEDVF